MFTTDRAAFLASHEFASEIERDRALAILDRIEAAAGARCPACERPLVAQEIVESVVLGFQDAPQCHLCLSAEHGESPTEFLERMEGYVAAIACFRATWAVSAERGSAITVPPDVTTPDGRG